MNRTFRLRAVGAVAATALLLAACQTGAPPASPSAGAGQPLVLVVAEGAAGTYQASGNAYALTLTDVDPEMTWFDDRPFRHAGVVPVQQALDVLFSEEASGPPNAALSVAATDAGPDLVTVIELTDPNYDPTGEGTLTFTATPLDAPKTGLDYYADRTTDSFPASFGAASLFIDTIFGYNYCGANVSNTGTTALELNQWSSNGNFEDGQPPAQIAGGSNVSFQFKSGWASNCNMSVIYIQQGDGYGFQLNVESPAIGDNRMQLQNSAACNVQGEIESTSGATATAQVSVNCPPSASAAP